MAVCSLTRTFRILSIKGEENRTTSATKVAGRVSRWLSLHGVMVAKPFGHKLGLIIISPGYCFNQLVPPWTTEVVIKR